MKNKIIIGIGVLTVLGISYYLIKKNNRDKNIKTENDKKEVTIESVQEYKQQKKDIKSKCGKKPSILEKEKLEQFNLCVSQISSFMGDFDDFTSEYID